MKDYEIRATLSKEHMMLGGKKLKPDQTVSVLKVVKLLVKAVKYGKDGFSKEELKELGTDLLTLGLEILEDIQD